MPPVCGVRIGLVGRRDAFEGVDCGRLGRMALYPEVFSCAYVCFLHLLIFGKLWLPMSWGILKNRSCSVALAWGFWLARLMMTTRAASNGRSLCPGPCGSTSHTPARHPLPVTREAGIVPVLCMRTRSPGGLSDVPKAVQPRTGRTTICTHSVCLQSPKSSSCCVIFSSWCS